MHLSLYGKHLWLNAGLYPGEEFSLIDVALFNVVTDADRKIDLIAFVTIQVCYFTITFGWRRA